MTFAMESQESSHETLILQFLFALFLGKINDKIFKKKQKAKYLIFGPFLPKFGQK